MKFTAQTTTTRPLDAAITARLGARPAEVSTYPESGQPFFAHGEPFDAVQPRRKADPRACRDADRALRRHRHFRLDDIFMPVTAARGYRPGRNKIRRSPKPPVVCAPHPRLPHPTAPPRDGLSL